MLPVPRAVPPTVTALPARQNSQFSSIEDDDDDLNDYPSQRPSMSDERFYLPVCSPVVTNQPHPLPNLLPLPGKFPSTKDDTEEELKPARRTSPLVVVQTGVFYFFSCGWCGPTDLSKRVRKEAEEANQSLGLRERWKYEIENRPKALRKLIKTTADNVETNIVPSIMARVSHHYHYYTGTEPTSDKGMDVKSMHSEDTYAPLAYSRWRGKEIPKSREGSRAAPPIQNFAASTNVAGMTNNDLVWMMQPPPAAVWKSDGRQGPRLALAEEDELVKEKIEPRLISRPSVSARPRPTIMRIPTLPSIESLNTRMFEEQQREQENMPQIPPAVLQATSTSPPTRRMTLRIPLPMIPTAASHSKASSLELSLSPISPIMLPFAPHARSMSWETATATTSRSSSERDLTSRGTDGTSSPTTIYSTIPRLKSPSLTKSALAETDEDGNLEITIESGELKFLPRTLSVKVKAIEIDDEDLERPPIPASLPLASFSPRTGRRRSIPLSGLRI